MTEEEVHSCLIAFVKKFSLTSIPIITGVVSDVDEEEYTCTLLVDDDTDGLKGVRLKMALDNTENGIITIPENDATAVVMVLNNIEHDLVLLHASKYKEMRLNVEKLVFNKGLNKGLVLVEKLLTKLNNLENQHNKLLLDFTTHVNIDPISGVTGTISVPPQSTSIIPTQLIDIENKNIIQ